MDKKKSKKVNKKITVKGYIKDFFKFFNTNLIKTTKILLLVAVLLVALSIVSFVNSVALQDCVGTCRDGSTIGSEFISKVNVILITLVAGIVPYIYLSVLGFLGYVLKEVYVLAFVIKGHGYFLGTILGIIPLILNIICISLITAAAIYICKTVTVGYRISNLSNMNLLNFKIKFYQILGNEEKQKLLANKKDKKMETLKGKKEKINYIQLLNISVIVALLQFVSVIIQEILI